MMGLTHGIKPSGYAALGGAVANVVKVQFLDKQEFLTKARYGVPAAMFAIGHIASLKVNPSLGHGMCALAGFMAADYIQNPNGGNAQGFFNDAGAVRQFGQGNNGAPVFNQPAFSYT